MPDRPARPLSPDRPMLTRHDVARILRVSTFTVDAWVRNGLLRPLRRPGVRRVLFHPDHIDAFARGDQEKRR